MVERDTQAVQQWTALLEHATTLQVPLLIHVARRALERGLSWQAFADETGLPKGYLLALASGRRNTAHISQDSARALASFLDWPPIAVKAMAGQIGLADFYTETDLARQPEAMSVLLRAPQLAHEPASVAVFAGVLACLDGRLRVRLRDVCADGPVERH